MLDFTQKQIELDIAEVLENGDITKISQISGIGYSYVDQQLNPNDDRKSVFYGALQIICALDEFAPERGEKVFQIFARFRELSKKRQTGLKDLNLETSKLNREVAEFVGAKLEGKPYQIQLKELLDIEKQILEVKAALIEEFNILKETPRGARNSFASSSRSRL